MRIGRFGLFAGILCGVFIPVVLALTTYTPVNTTYTATVQLPVDGQDARTAASVTTPMKVLADNIAYLYANTLGGGAYVANPADMTGSSYEVVNGIGGPWVRLDSRETYTTARTVAAASPEYGHTWLNRTSASGDEQTTNAGQLTLTAAAASLNWFGGVYTTPYRYVTLQNYGQMFAVVARIASNGNASDEAACVQVTQDNNDSKYFRMCVGYQAATNLSASMAGSGTTVSMTGTERDNGAWVLMLIQGQTAAGYYNLTNQSTVPTSWTFMQQSTTLFSGIGYALKVGELVYTGATADGTLIARWKYLRIDEHASVVGGNPSWGAQQYDTGGPVVSWPVQYIGGRELTQSVLRNAVSSAVERRLDDTAALTTCRFTRCATVGCTGSGSYAVPASMTIAGTVTAPWALLECKITSGGDTNASIGRVVIPIQ